MGESGPIIHGGDCASRCSGVVASTPGSGIGRFGLESGEEKWRPVWPRLKESQKGVFQSHHCSVCLPRFPPVNVVR